MDKRKIRAKLDMSLARVISATGGRRWLVATFGFTGFCMAYLGKHFYRPLGEVHREIIALLDNDLIREAAVVSFRESGKSTLVTFAYALYVSIEGIRHFVILIGDTSTQAELMIQNIKTECETNKLLLEDYGSQETKTWSNTRLIFRGTATRITPRSKGQKMRGLKHRQYRPDLILADDPEARDDVKTADSRLETYKWFTQEVMGARDKERGKIFIIGNLLHEDALIPKLDKMKLVRRHDIPIERNGVPTWLGAYPTIETILTEKARNELVYWMREYELKIIAEEGQIIAPEDIHYYDEMAKIIDYACIGVDLAISQKDSANYTAMVGAKAGQNDGEFHIYIHPKVVNAHLDFHKTQQTLKTFALEVGTDYPAHLFIEDVAYQKAAIQEIERAVLPVTGISPGGKDKRARLMTVSHLIKKGVVLFPREGANDLIQQVIGFGTEAHDDMVDAMVILLFGMSSWGIQEIQWLD